VPGKAKTPGPVVCGSPYPRSSPASGANLRLPFIRKASCLLARSAKWPVRLDSFCRPYREPRYSQALHRGGPEPRSYLCWPSVTPHRFSNLAIVGHLNLLKLQFSRAWRQIPIRMRSRYSGCHPREMDQNSDSPKRNPVKPLLPSLHPGEAEAIALAVDL
jgi:hypothetical protein